MIKLPRPNVPEPESHKKVLAARRPKLDKPEIVAALAERFQHYFTSAPDFKTLPARGPEFVPYLDALHGLYESTTDEAEEIRRAVESGRPRRCPYCGRTGTPATLDHVLPRSKHQEFSLLAVNLIPSCWECNHKKLDKIRDETTGIRLYLNPYYDEFIADRFVHLRIVADNARGYDIPLFDLSFAWSGSTDEQIATCGSHFRLLCVTDMLREFFSSKLRSLHRRIDSRKQRKALSVEQVRNELVDEEGGETAEHGINCWESIFLRAVHEDSALLEYLISSARTPSGPCVESPISPPV